MIFLKRYKREIVLFILIGALFFFSRLYNIMSLPLFTDEAIYTRWSQIARYDAGWRFISLTDGKQPLFVWLTMVTTRFVKDPLLAGRLVSVGAGFVTLIGLFFLGKEIFKNAWVGVVSSALYLIFPMALVYDRMALYDSMVGTFAVWSLYLQVLLVRRLRLDVALILGMIMGGGVLTKTSGFFSIYLLPFTLLLFDWQKSKKGVRLLQWVGLAFISTVLSYGFYSILRLSPFFHIIDEKNALFVYSIWEWLEHPLRFLWGNLLGQWNWLHMYLTWPIVILIPISYIINRKFLREKLLLLVWFFLPFFALALFGKVLYPRFIFFMTLFLLPLAAFSLYTINQRIKSKLLFVVCCLLSVVLVIRSDYLVLTDFANAPIPYSDLSQYNNDWPSGGGVKEAVSFFKEQAKKQKIYVATEGTFGLMPYALELYLVDNPNIKIQGFWPVMETPPKEVMEASKKMPAYFVFYQPCSVCVGITEAPRSWPTTTVLKIKKGDTETYLTVYQIKRK